MKKYKIGLIIAAAFLLFIIYKIVYDYKISKDMKDAVVIVGKVESIEYTRGITIVHVQYLYDKKNMHSFFGTYDREILDSLKDHKYVRIRVSKHHPSEHIEYIGLGSPTN